MSTATTLQIVSTSSAVTEQLAEQLARLLRGGEVIELVSDLGGGKTTFVRGLARGIGSKDHVSSPTFKISNIYQGSKLELHHFDFYRLSEAGIIVNELAEVMSRPEAVTVIEWSDIVQKILPGKRMTIRFIPEGADSRRLEITCPENLSYLLESLHEQN